MGTLQLIATSNFITVNKEIIKKVGLEEAIILGELASEYDYWEKRGELVDGYFYSTINNIEEKTTLSEHKQRKALKKMKALGLVDVKVKGQPAKRYIKINEDAITTFLNNSGSSSSKIKGLDSKELKGNNNITNNNIKNNKKEIKEDKKSFTNFEEFRTKENKDIEPSVFTKKLIRSKYIDKEDLDIIDYNELIDYLIHENGHTIVNSALNYFCKGNKFRKNKDENFNEIQNKYSYFKTSIESGIDRLHRINNSPLSYI